ncbi:hypothetical protein KCP75_15175 [Salmonella enterica subsp. enterica]|nr:hypothetical protein KCP75_15175 [Salmonella enterica subsp. enterica]
MHIELIATSAGKVDISVSALSVCTARYRTVTPYQPRTLSTSVSHDAKMMTRNGAEVIRRCWQN